MHNENYPAYRLGDVVKKLPLCAAQKLRQINAAVTDAAALIASTDARKQELEPSYIDLQRRLSRLDPRDDEDDIHRLRNELTILEAETRNLDNERSKRAAAKANSEQIRAQIESWLGAFETGGVQIDGALRWAKVKPFARRKGESLKDSLIRLRNDIAQLKSEIVRTKSAPLPPAEVKRQIIRQVNALADKGRPILNLEDGKVDLRFSDMPMFGDTGAALPAPSGSATALLCWLHGDQIIEALTAGLDGLDGGLSPEAREQKLAELDRDLLTLELQEEHLVVAALAAGLECHRRISASPLAILNLEPVSHDELESQESEAAE
jgi:hypothetical protein